jgi:hypothetical protein
MFDLNNVEQKAINAYKIDLYNSERLLENQVGDLS